MLLGCMGEAAAVWLPWCPCRGAKLYTARMPPPACMQKLLVLTARLVKLSIAVLTLTGDWCGEDNVRHNLGGVYLRRGGHHAAVKGVLARLQVDELRLGGCQRELVCC